MKTADVAYAQADNDNKPKTLGNLIDLFASEIEPTFISHEKSRKKYEIKINNSKYKNFLNSAVEFRYLEKATHSNKNAADITDSQREMIENSIVSERHTFKEALLESVLDEIFKKIKKEETSETSRYFATLKEEGEDLIYTFEFDIISDLPEFDLSTFTIDQYESSITDSDIEKEMNSIVENETFFDDAPEDLERVVTENDAVNISFKGFIKKKAFEGGSADNYNINLPDKTMLPDFHNGVISMKQGETKIVEVRFPENYGSKALAGSKADFHITLNKFLEKRKFTSIDEFVSKSVFKNKDQLTQVLKNELEFNLDSLLWSIQRDGVTKIIDSSVSVDLPELVVEQQFAIERQSYMDRKLKTLQSKISNEEELKKLIEDSKDEIKQEVDELKNSIRKRVKVSLFLNDLGKKHKLELNDQQKSQECTKQAKLSKMPLDQFMQKMQNDTTGSIYNNVIAGAFERMLIQFILTKANVNKIQLTFDQVKEKYKELFINGSNQ